MCHSMNQSRNKDLFSCYIIHFNNFPYTDLLDDVNLDTPKQKKQGGQAESLQTNGKLTMHKNIKGYLVNICNYCKFLS